MEDKTTKEKIQPDEAYIQALLLAEVVKRILTRKAGLELSGKPVLTKRPVVEFKKRMRIPSVGKFPEKTYISIINFFKNEEESADHQCLGTIIVYIPESFIVKLFHALDYPALEEDDYETMEDACGTFCNLVAGNYKSGLTQLGYDDLFMSPFYNFQNDAPEGVIYPTSQQHYYQIDFEVKNKQSIVVDLVVASLPKLYSL